MKLSRIGVRVIFCALMALAAGGCTATRLAAEAKASQAHLDEQDSHLNEAARHLQEALRRLAGQADPHQAGSEVTAGYAQVRQASAVNQKIRQDVAALGGEVASLRHQIDKHRNDWLGPRGHRVCIYVIVVGILVSLGAALLELGPLFGGPLGGGAIVAGHVLTAFALPLFRELWTLAGYAWSELIAGWKWISGELASLAGDKAAVSPPAAGGSGANATT